MPSTISPQVVSRRLAAVGFRPVQSGSSREGLHVQSAGWSRRSRTHTAVRVYADHDSGASRRDAIAFAASALLDAGYVVDYQTADSLRVTAHDPDATNPVVRMEVLPEFPCMMIRRYRDGMYDAAEFLSGGSTCGVNLSPGFDSAGRLIAFLREQRAATITPVIEPGDLAGVAEVATILGVSKQRVTQLRQTAGFPSPVAILAAGPVWRTQDVADWNARRHESRPPENWTKTP